MIQPIDHNTARQNFSPTFRPVFDLIKEKYIQPTEPIFAACCCTYMHKIQLDYGKNPLRMDASPSLLVISDHRWIRAGLRSSWNRSEVTYDKSGSAISAMFGNDYFEYKWIEVKADLSRLKDISEHIYIKEVPLSKLQVNRRTDYKVNVENQELKLVELMIDSNAWVAFKEADGNRVYAVMQEAAKNNGRIELGQQGSLLDPGEALKKAKELLDLGLISQQEYELKKQEILSRL